VSGQIGGHDARTEHALPFLVSPVGRTGELGRLRDRLALARLGNGGLVTVSGPAGIGKSTLLTALRRAASAVPPEPDAIPTVAGHCVVVNSACRLNGPPLGVWSRLVARAALASGQRSPDPASARDLSEASRIVLSALEALPGTVLALIDDAHLMGDESRTILRTVHDGLAQRRILLVIAVQRPAPGVGRPLPIPDLEIALAAFSAAEVTALVADRRPDLLPEERDDLVGRLLTTTGGIPIDLVVELSAEPAQPIPTTSDDGTTGGDAVMRAVSRLDEDQRAALTSLAIADGLSADDAAHHAGLPPAAVRSALAAATAQRLTTVSDGVVRLHSRAADALLGRLDEDVRAALELAIGRSLATDPEVSAAQVADHLLRSGAHARPSEVAEAAMRAAREAIDRLALAEADRFLAAAEERIDAAADPQRALELHLLRATLLADTGDLDGMGRHAAMAARIARDLRDADRLAEAAVLHAYPPDWRRASIDSRRLLRLADEARPSPVWRSRVLASRAIVEMRHVLVADHEEEWAWETHPDVARPLAAQALDVARSTGDRVALVESLLAWRNSHRAPQFLAMRRAAAHEALELAQRGAGPTLVFESALRAALDDLEAGDRDGFEAQQEILHCASERADQRRLHWRRCILQATAAALDGDLDGVARQRQAALVLGAGQTFSGRTVAQVILTAYELLMRGTLAPFITAISDDLPVLSHPLALAVTARAVAQHGDDEWARRLLAQLRDRPIEEEASLLAMACEAGRSAVAIGDAETADWALRILTPFTEHAALDSEGLWPPQPVALVTGQLRMLLGSPNQAHTDRGTALRVATSLRSRTALDELDDLRDLHDLHAGIGLTATVAGTVEDADGPHVEPQVTAAQQAAAAQLTPRQLAVLQRLASGLTNEDIAADLLTSRATVVREIGEVYRVLGASNRAVAARIAADLQLIAR
jgi:DNA-binding CsgD family transcriptional regulator